MLTIDTLNRLIDRIPYATAAELPRTGEKTTKDESLARRAFHAYGLLHPELDLSADRIPLHQAAASLIAVQEALSAQRTLRGMAQRLIDHALACAGCPLADFTITQLRLDEADYAEELDRAARMIAGAFEYGSSAEECDCTIYDIGEGAVTVRADADSGAYTVEALLAYGGPSLRVSYSSSEDALTVTYESMSALIEVVSEGVYEAGADTPVRAALIEHFEVNC